MIKRLVAILVTGAALAVVAEPSATAGAAGPLAVDTQGEVVGAWSDYVSPREGMPLLAGSGANAFRITWTASRDVPDRDVAAAVGQLQALTISLPEALDDLHAMRLGSGPGHCLPGGTASQPEVVRGTADGRITLTFPGLTCAAGDVLDLTVTGWARTVTGETAPVASGDHDFDALLSERPPYPDPDGFFPADEVGRVRVHAEAPVRSVTISDAPPPNADPYARLITITVRNVSGAVDTAYDGSVELGRARCGIPAYEPHQVVDGVVTFLVVSPDFGRTYWVEDPDAPGGSIEVESPRSVDTWVARLGDGTALLAQTSLELGSPTKPLVTMGDGYQCPTRSIF